MVADNPDQKIELKAFCAEIQNDHEALAKEHAAFEDLPEISSVNKNKILENYLSIKKGSSGHYTDGNGKDAGYTGIDGFDY